MSSIEILILFGLFVSIVSNTINISKNPIAIAIISALLSAIFIGYISFYYNNKLEDRRNEDFKSRRQKEIYSQLRGRKALVLQLCESYGHSYVRFHAIKRTLQIERGNPRFDRESALQDYQQSLQRQYVFSVEWAKSIRDLWETISLIESYFPPNAELNYLIETIMSAQVQFRTNYLPKPPDDLCTDQIGKWEIEQNSIRHDFINEVLGESIINLEKYIKT